MEQETQEDVSPEEDWPFKCIRLVHLKVYALEGLFISGIFTPEWRKEATTPCQSLQTRVDKVERTGEG